MADIPPNLYNVKIRIPGLEWAIGTLDTKKTPPTYKGKPVDPGYSLDQNDVHWIITLQHGTQSCSFDFKDGVYDGSMRTVNGKKLNLSNCAGVTDGQNDTWSAEAVPPGPLPDETGYRT